MATINLNNLRPAGADLFLESENYLNELTDADLTNIQGGFVGFVVSAVVTLFVLAAACEKVVPLNDPPQRT